MGPIYGVLAHGFARLPCIDCAFERLVPFSCKGRGFACSPRSKTLTRFARSWPPLRGRKSWQTERRLSAPSPDIRHSAAIRARAPSGRRMRRGPSTRVLAKVPFPVQRCLERHPLTGRLSAPYRGGAAEATDPIALGRIARHIVDDVDRVPGRALLRVALHHGEVRTRRRQSDGAVVVAGGAGVLSALRVELDVQPRRDLGDRRSSVPSSGARRCCGAPPSGPCPAATSASTSRRAPNRTFGCASTGSNAERTPAPSGLGPAHPPRGGAPANCCRSWVGGNFHMIRALDKTWCRA